MPKTTVFIATSLDGFIAREDDDIEWLHNSGHGDVEKGEDFGFAEFMKSVDALVMGRNTFDKVLSLDGKWLYGNTPVFVLTHRGITIPKELKDTVAPMSGPPAEIVAELAEKGYEHLYIDGGQTIQQFLEAGMIDQLIITRIPILIGSGIPLFGPLTLDIKLRHINTQSFNNGFVQSTYEVSR